MARRQGCWVAIAGCFNSKGSDERILFEKKATNTIEFENLVTAERREVEARRSRQMVTDAERDYAMSGNFDQLVEEQRRIDEERDAELRRQEEELRQEQEAYYAAKREAAKRSRPNPQNPFSEFDDSTAVDQSTVSFNFPSHLSSSTSASTMAPPQATPTTTTATVITAPPTTRTIVKTGTHSLSQPHPWHTTTSFTSGNTATSAATSDSGLSKDDLDFDEFLESVKARQQSMTTNLPSVSSAPSKQQQQQQPTAKVESDSEEEIDFGFWEKATPIPDPPTHQLKQEQQQQSRTDNLMKEVDLNLL